jgi:fibronectin-binding autotransporter adhesin
MAVASILVIASANAGNINWDGDDAVGNFSFNDNWFGDSNPINFGGWVFTNDLHFSVRNNAGQSSLFYDYNSFQNIGNIFFDNTWNGSIPWDGDGTGLNFNQTIQNNSSSVITFGSITLSGAKNGAGHIEFNPAAGDMILNFTNGFFNDNSVPYQIFGGGGHTLTINCNLGVGATAANVTFTDETNNIVKFAAAQSLAGDTFILAGKIEFDSAGSVASDFIRLGDTTGSATAELDLNGVTVANKINVVSGSSGLKTIAALSGSGANILSNNIFLDTGVTVTANTGSSLTLSGGTLDLKTQTMTLSGAGNITISGVLQNSTGSGALTSNNTGTVSLNGANTYTGATTINSGTVKLGNATALGTAAAGTTVATGAILDLNGQAVGAEAVMLNGTGISAGGALINSSGTAASLSGVVTLTGTTSLGGSGNFTLSSGIAGAGATNVLDKVGNGTVTLTAAAGTNRAASTATTQIDGGVLRIQNASAVNTGTTAVTTINNGATLELAAVTLNQPITLNSGGTLRSDGSSINQGTITISNVTSASVTLSTVSSGDTFTVGNGNNDITGGSTSSAIHVAGPGSVLLSQVSNYVGNWSLDNGTLLLQSDGTGSQLGATNTATLTLNGGTLRANYAATGNISFTGGPGNNVLVAANSTILNDRTTSGITFNTYTFGNLSIGSLTLNATAGTNYTSTATPTTIFGSTSLTGNPTFNVVKGTNVTSGTTILQLGALNDNAVARTITKSGSGDLTLTANATSLINGTAVNITGGKLNSSVASALGALANVTVSTGATFNIGASQTIGALNSSGTGFATLGANTLIIGSTNNLTSGFDGVISGTGGSIIKDGTAILTLTGSNSYTGTTTISNGTLSAGNIVVASGVSNLGNSSTAVILGDASNKGTLSYTGAAATYVRGFTVNAGGGGLTNAGTGLLQVSTVGTTIASSGTLTFTTNANGIQDNSTSVISGAGSVALNSTGAGALTLAAQNTYQGGTTLTQGTLVLGTSSTITTGTLVSGPVGTGTFHIGSGTNFANVQTNITGGRTINNNISLDGDATFSTTQISGNIFFDTIGTLTTPNTIALTRTNQLTINSVVGLTLGGSVTGLGFGLTKLGTGSLALGGGNGDATNNTYTGLTTVSAGSLSLNKAANTNAFGGDIMVNGGTLAYGVGNDEQIANSAKVSISSGSYSVSSRTETIGQTGTPTSGLALSGTGAISLSTGQLNLSNSATVSGGSITVTGTTGVIQANTELNFSGGTIDFQSNSGSSTAAVNLRGGTGTGITYSASGTSAAQITNSGGGTARVSLDGTSGATTVFNIGDSASVGTELTIGVNVTGGASGGVQKTGAGVLALTGANTYSGPTAINAGTLLANNSSGSATSSGAVTVNSGGTLGGTGSINTGSNNINITATTGSAKITGATNGTIGALTLTASNVVFTGANASNLASYVVDLNSATSDLLAITGNLTLSSLFDQIAFQVQGATGAASYTLATYTGSLTGTFDNELNLPTGYFVDYSHSGQILLTMGTPVPEPGTWLIGGFAVGALLVSQRRRTRAAKR